MPSDPSHISLIYCILYIIQFQFQFRYTTNGGYRVALPDGRIQVVTYNVLNANSGYVADVKYEGNPSPYAAPSKPAYGPAPVPAPVIVKTYKPAASA